MANEFILLRESVMKKLALKSSLNLVLLGVLAVTFNPVQANSDREAMEAVQKARAQIKDDNKKDHAKHVKSVKETGQYRGVFYGILPCKDCDGAVATLSLKNKHNYLLVTQPVKPSSREFYEKGKYVWDDEAKIVTLTSRKDKSIQQYTIKDEKTLLPIIEKGKVRKTSKKRVFSLRKRDHPKKPINGGHNNH